MLQTLQVTGYTCSRPKFLLNNSYEEVELPVQVENRRCSDDFKVGLTRCDLSDRLFFTHARYCLNLKR